MLKECIISIVLSSIAGVFLALGNLCNKCNWSIAERFPLLEKCFYALAILIGAALYLLIAFVFTGYENNHPGIVIYALCSIVPFLVFLVVTTLIIKR